jgi:glycosyltransferase involved in cell wall biosynthesis
MLAHVAVADLVLCSNERQRDLLIGAALAADRLTADGAMPPLHERLVVVPHGLELESLCPGRSTLRTGALADEGLRLALWAGGMWSWLDPLTAIKAVERLRAHRPELRLAFVGTEHPDPDQRRAHAGPATHAAAYVRDHGLEEVVIFRPQWLSRREYVDHLVDADVGVSLNGSTLEARYASRTRVVDYLSAGLPVVCTGGDTMSDLVAAGELGMVVDAGDVDGCAAALDRLTQGAPRRIGNGAAVESLRWSNVAWPLVEFCLGTTLTPSASRRASLAAVARTYPAFVRAIHRQHGAGALAGAVARRAARLMRRQ